MKDSIHPEGEVPLPSIHEHHQLEGKLSGQQDIILFLKKGAVQTTLHVSNDKKLSFSIPKIKDDPIDKMMMIRNKMVEARRSEEFSQMKDAVTVRKQ